MASAVFGVLNHTKTRALRETLSASETAREQADRLRLNREKEWKAREQPAPSAKIDDNQAKIERAETDLVKSETEKQELQAKIRASESEIAELKKRLESESPKAEGTDSIVPPILTSADAAVEERRAERVEPEKITTKQKGPEGHSAHSEKPRKQRAVTRANPSLHGRVLAVNQAYNFVVLNLGAREGVESNSEMLVVRGGGLIGKIRISSVEPATAIGDIVTSTLARGVQVQPGDTVIYAGTNF